jgi:hypothetical protein
MMCDLAGAMAIVSIQLGGDPIVSQVDNVPERLRIPSRAVMSLVAMSVSGYGCRMILQEN